MQIRCYGCKNLISKPDAAGGGIYTCRRFPRIVIEEWGYWTSKVDEPVGNTECYEREEGNVKQNYFDWSLNP